MYNSTSSYTLFPNNNELVHLCFKDDKVYAYVFTCVGGRGKDVHLSLVRAARRAGHTTLLRERLSYPSTRTRGC